MVVRIVLALLAMATLTLIVALSVSLWPMPDHPLAPGSVTVCSPPNGDTEVCLPANEAEK